MFNVQYHYSLGKSKPKWHITAYLVENLELKIMIHFSVSNAEKKMALSYIATGTIKWCYKSGKSKVKNSKQTLSIQLSH